MSAAMECFFDVFVFAFKEKHMRLVVTKWATSRQGTEGELALYVIVKHAIQAVT